MTITLRILLILISIATFMSIIRRIGKSGISIDDAIFWIFFSAVIVLFGLFPGLADMLAGLLGIYSTANFLFLTALFVLIVKLFGMTLKVSQLEEKLKNLAQHDAIREHEDADGGEK